MFSTFFADTDEKQTEKVGKKNLLSHFERSRKPTMKRRKTYFQENNFPEQRSSKILQLEIKVSVGWSVAKHQWSIGKQQRKNWMN